MGTRNKLLLITDGYRRLFRKPSFVLLWTGQTVSVFGDAFFNLAVMWVVWSETQSTLQTAVIQAVWHIPDVLFAPLAGVLADRRDRKAIMVTTNVAAAAVVGAVVLIVVLVGHLPPVIAFVAIFKLNSLTTFMNPARASIMPAVVGRDLLTTAQGLFSTARETAGLVGSAAAGLLIAATSAVWALVVDAASFMFVSLCIALARLPGRAAPPAAPNEIRPSLSPRSVARDLREGWRTASRLPVVRALLWLGLLINTVAFIGPLWPALVQERLSGGADFYGVLLAAAAAGGMMGGLVAGPLERRLGAGRVLASGWAIAGVCTLAIAGSTWLPVTMVLEFVETASLTAGMVVSSAIMITAVREEYRGRVFGIVRSLSVILIPVSALAGGWVAEFVEIWIMFAAAGAIVLALALLAWMNPNVRLARV
ncbi:MAG: MFS transporter [Chloroflexi bacterium]|nr:MFS transporter [Chloroflexota bacterium]MCY3938521.1 MFS transporter [Chloroflexota bacterium]